MPQITVPIGACQVFSNAPSTGGTTNFPFIPQPWRARRETVALSHAGASDSRKSITATERSALPRCLHFPRKYCRRKHFAARLPPGTLAGVSGNGQCISRPRYCERRRSLAAASARLGACTRSVDARRRPKRFRRKAPGPKRAANCVPRILHVNPRALENIPFLLVFGRGVSRCQLTTPRPDRTPIAIG
jgi:hypothetical protein